MLKFDECRRVVRNLAHFLGHLVVTMNDATSTRSLPAHSHRQRHLSYHVLITVTSGSAAISTQPAASSDEQCWTTHLWTEQARPHQSCIGWSNSLAASSTTSRVQTLPAGQQGSTWSCTVVTNRLLSACFSCQWSNYNSLIKDCAQCIFKPQLAIARLRLHASMMPICLSVCLFVCRQNAKKRDFLKN